MGSSQFTIAQQLVIVHGRPAWFGQFVIALINGSGLFAFSHAKTLSCQGYFYGPADSTMFKIKSPEEDRATLLIMPMRM
jgi:hypothetical protein